MNVVGEGGPGREGLKVLGYVGGPDVAATWISELSSDENCISVIRKREIWDPG